MCVSCLSSHDGRYWNSRHKISRISRDESGCVNRAHSQYGCHIVSRTSQDEFESGYDGAYGQDGSRLHRGNPSDDVKVNLNSQSQDISAAFGASTTDTDTEAINNMNHLIIKAYGESLVGFGVVQLSDDWYNLWEIILLLGR